MYDAGPFLVNAGEGKPIVTVGGVLSAMKVALGPTGRDALFAASVHIPAGREIPSVPSPVMSLIVKTLVLPVPLTDMVPEAFPVLLRMTLADWRLMEKKLSSLQLTV